MSDRLVEINGEISPAMVVLTTKDQGDFLGVYHHNGISGSITSSAENLLVAYRNVSTETIIAKLNIADFYTTNEGIIAIDFFDGNATVTGGTWHSINSSVINYNNTFTSYSSTHQVYRQFLSVANAVGGGNQGLTNIDLASSGFNLSPGMTMVITTTRLVGSTSSYKVGYSFNWNEFKY